MRPASSASAISISRGCAHVQSSSAACNVGATAFALAQRDKSLLTTTRRPSRPSLSDASFMALLRFAPLRVEMFLQPAPAVDVISLQGWQRGGIAGHALAEPRLEHEGERIREHHRLEFDIASVLEGVAVGAM